MNNILNTSFDTLYVFAGMVLIEYIVALILAAKKNLKLLRLLLATLTGNAITATMCLFLPAGNSDFGYYAWLGIAFALSVVAEWFIYMAYFRTEDYSLSNLRFFFASLFGNLITFVGLFLLNHFEVIE